MNVLVGVGAIAVLLVGAPVRAADIASPASSAAGADKLARILAGKTGPMAKIGTALSELHHEYQAHEQRSQALERDSAETLEPLDFRPSDPMIQMVDSMVVIDAVAAGNVEVLVRDLRALGAQNVSFYGRVVSARMPVAALEGLARLDSLQLARPAMATRNVGVVTSEGDAAMNADLAREEEKVNGRRATVGTLSDGFDCLGGAADDIASDDLPRRLIILDDSACPGSDEGRAMMQIVHDVAPRARQAFHTAFNGQADFANGIIELATRARADVIVDDVIYFAEPMFQDGIIAQAVDAVRARGVAYFSASGNGDRNSWDSGDTGFVASGVLGVFGGERHDFDPGPGVDDLQSVVIGTGTTIFAFQWDQPFFSVSGAPGSASDMDILLYAPGLGFLGLGGFTDNLGGDSVEVFGVTNSGPPLVLEIGLELFAGPAPGVMKYVIFPPRVNQIGDPPPSFVLEFPTDSSTNYGHSNAAGAAAVGAAFWRNTPRFGESPPVVENFSSAGGTPILFNRNGVPISPRVRSKPNFVAPDGGATTFFGGRDSFGMADPNGTNFFGTSAAAPHAAAVAALMLDANRRLRPQQLYKILGDTAVDMDDPDTPGFDHGFDFATGFGLVNALDAVEAAKDFNDHHTTDHLHARR